MLGANEYDSSKIRRYIYIYVGCDLTLYNVNEKKQKRVFLIRQETEGVEPYGIAC
jgi:hypothetical protein